MIKLFENSAVIIIFCLALSLAACEKNGDRPVTAEPAAADGDRYAEQRNHMVDRQIQARGIDDHRLLIAMRKVPRHLFVPENIRKSAYSDQPLPIGFDQTISQPFIVAFMTEALALEPGDKVLEIGTGSGYQTAVLAELVSEVYSIEIVCELEARAKNTLTELGYDNVFTKCGDGYQGWPEKAPFDAIMVTAAPDHVPPPLIEQLADGGKLIIPVGSYIQELMLIEKTSAGVVEKSVLPVRFVPMTGEAQK